MFVSATAIAVVAAFAPVQVDRLVGIWDGSLALPEGRFLPVSLRVIRGADGKISAFADSPTQGDMDRPVRNLTLQDGLVRFEIEGIDGQAEARLVGETMTGVWKSPEGEVKLTLTRKPAA